MQSICMKGIKVDVAAEKGLDGCVAEILKAFVSPSYAGSLHAAVIFNSQGILTWI